MREYLYGFLKGVLAAGAVGAVLAASVGLSLAVASVRVGVDPFAGELLVALGGAALCGGAAGVMAVRVRRRERAVGNRPAAAVWRVRVTRRVMPVLLVAFVASVALLYAVSPEPGPLPAVEVPASERDREEGKRIRAGALADSLEAFSADAQTLQTQIETRVRQALLFAEGRTLGGFVHQNGLSTNSHVPPDTDPPRPSYSDSAAADTAQASLRSQERAALRSVAGLLRQGAWGRLAFAFERAPFERELNRWLGIHHRGRVAVGPDTAQVVLKASVLRALGVRDRQVRSALGRSVRRVQVEHVQRSSEGVTVRLRAELSPAASKVAVLASAYQRDERPAVPSVRLRLLLDPERWLLAVRP